MLYKAILDCTDIGGRHFRRGEIVDLPEGKHSDFLKPLDEPVEVIQPEEEIQEVTEKDETPKSTAKSKSAKK